MKKKRKYARYKDNMSEEGVNKEDKIQIGEISSLIGTPSSTLRFYETHGIISPEKNIENNYRVFTPAQSCNILMSRMYRSYDLKLEEISGMVTTNTHDRNLEILKTQSETLEKEIAKLKAVQKALDSYIELCEIAASLQGMTRVIDNPGYYFIGNIAEGKLKINSGIKTIVKQWMEHLPFIKYSVRIDCSPKAMQEGDIGNWGFSVSEDLADKYRLNVSAPVQYYKPRKCLMTAVRRSTASFFTQPEIQQILAVLGNPESAIPNELYGHFLGIEHSEKEPAYLYVIYLPIK